MTYQPEALFLPLAGVILLLWVLAVLCIVAVVHGAATVERRAREDRMRASRDFSGNAQ